MGQPLFQWDSGSRFGREGGAAVSAKERLAAGIEPYAAMISSDVEAPDRPNAQRNLEAAGSAYGNAEQLMGQVEGVSGNEAMKGMFSQAQNADWAGMAQNWSAAKKGSSGGKNWASAAGGLAGDILGMFGRGGRPEADKAKNRSVASKAKNAASTGKRMAGMELLSRFGA